MHSINFRRDAGRRKNSTSSGKQTASPGKFKSNHAFLFSNFMDERSKIKQDMGGRVSAEPAGHDHDDAGTSGVC